MGSKEFRGIFPYLVTPLDQKGRLKEQVLADLVDHLIRKGVHGLTPLGSTGEAPYLDWETKRRTIEVVVTSTAGSEDSISNGRGRQVSPQETQFRKGEGDVSHTVSPFFRGAHRACTARETCKLKRTCPGSQFL